MKTLRRFFALIIFGLFVSTPVFSYDVKIDGIYYDLTSDSTAAVTYEYYSYDMYYTYYCGDVIIPSSIQVSGRDHVVTEIGDHAFYSCDSLTSVTIPNSVTEIEDYAFKGCRGLTSVTIPNSVTEIEDCAFEGCRGLTSVTIPNSVTTIGYEAFKDCSGLTSVTIGNSVTTIGTEAFKDCSGLTSVTIGNSVTSIGHGAFYACSGLTSVTIPNSVKSIKDYAFCGCSGLNSVILGKSVTVIWKTAFKDCGDFVFEVLSSAPLAELAALDTKEVIFGKGYEESRMTHWSEWTSFEKIYAKDITPPMIGDSFSELQKKNLRVVVPTEALESYKAAPVWKDFVFLKGGAETAAVEGVTTLTPDEYVPVYGLDGRRVNTTVPGHIYIKGGKKFVAQ